MAYKNYQKESTMQLVIHLVLLDTKNSLNCFVQTNLHNCNTGTIQHPKRDFPVLNHFLALTPVTHPHEAAHKHMALFISQPRLQVSHIRHYRK